MANCVFFDDKSFAFFGMSRTKGKFGNSLYKYLTKQGYSLHAIHPHSELVQGTKTYPSIQQIPQKVQSAILCVSPKQAMEIVTELSEAGVKNVFLQQGTESKEVLKACREAGLRTFYKSCAILASKPEGFHAVHAFFSRIFGGGSKELLP